MNIFFTLTSFFTFSRIRAMKQTSLGQMIKTRRKELGLTAERLANKANIDRTYISKIEKHGFLPSPKLLTKIISNLNDTSDKYIRLYKSLKLESAMKSYKEKIKF